MQHDGNLSETFWCASPLAEYWSISTQWKVAKKIMEFERVFFFFYVFYSMHLGGWLAFVCRKNDKDCTLLTDTADLTFLLGFKCSVTLEMHFYVTLISAKKPKTIKKNNKNCSHDCSSVALKNIRIKDYFSKLSSAWKKRAMGGKGFRFSKWLFPLYQDFFVTVAGNG